MRRVDLRKSKDLFLKMGEVIENAEFNEVLVILFEIGDFSTVEKSFSFIKEKKCILLNSLKFNQKDWTIVIKKDKNAL